MDLREQWEAMTGLTDQSVLSQLVAKEKLGQAWWPCDVDVFSYGNRWKPSTSTSLRNTCHCFFRTPWSTKNVNSEVMVVF